MSDGTTHCPHCDTRFEIDAAQLEAHGGMVRCGHCLQAFDARPGFIPEPNPQLELPILGALIEELHAQEESQTANESRHIEEVLPVEQPVLVEELQPVEETQAVEDRPPVEEVGSHESTDDKVTALQPVTLAEQVVVEHDVVDQGQDPDQPYRKWPWLFAALMLLLLLLAQGVYFFRVELTAQLPELKPALDGYCQLLNCRVSLPKNVDLISIESSALEADPSHENQITMNALLRNRAPYAQAFPNLELTINDIDDKPIARRKFRPAEYLPPQENEKSGLLPNRELVIKLHLNTASLNPSGYRLALYYPAD